MNKVTLTVRIEFDNENRPDVIRQLFDHMYMCDLEDAEGGYVVTAASWSDPIARLEELEQLVEKGVDENGWQS